MFFQLRPFTSSNTQDHQNCIHSWGITCWHNGKNPKHKKPRKFSKRKGTTCHESDTTFWSVNLQILSCLSKASLLWKLNCSSIETGKHKICKNILLASVHLNKTKYENLFFYVCTCTWNIENFCERTILWERGKFNPFQRKSKYLDPSQQYEQHLLT